MGSITSANSVITFNAPDVYDAPVALMQFAADDAFQNEGVSSGTPIIGVDGIMASGFILAPVQLRVTLSPDSPSTGFFDLWYNKERQEGRKLYAEVSIEMGSIDMKYDLARCTMTKYGGSPAAKKRLHPIHYEFTCQSIHASDF